LRLVEYDYTQTPSIESIGFRLQRLPDFLYDSADDILQEFIQKLDDYQVDRDFFYKDASSKLSVHIRFSL
jgi:deoxyribodipyrimidine photo-lyase